MMKLHNLPQPALEMAPVLVTDLSIETSAMLLLLALFLCIEVVWTDDLGTGLAIAAGCGPIRRRWRLDIARILP